MGAQAREPGGRPTGGRFATGVRAEPGISLPAAPAGQPAGGMGLEDMREFVDRVARNIGLPGLPPEHPELFEARAFVDRVAANFRIEELRLSGPASREVPEDLREFVDRVASNLSRPGQPRVLRRSGRSAQPAEGPAHLDARALVEQVATNLRLPAPRPSGPAPALLSQEELNLARWEEEAELAALAWEQGI